MGRREEEGVRGREVAIWAHNLFKFSPSANPLAQPSDWFWVENKNRPVMFSLRSSLLLQHDRTQSRRFESSKYANKQPPGKRGTRWLTESAKQYARVLRAGSLQRDAVDLGRAAGESWLLVVVILTLSAGGGERELGLGHWWSLRAVVFERADIRLDEIKNKE